MPRSSKKPPIKQVKKRPFIAGLIGGLLFAVLQLIIDYFIMGGNPDITRIVVAASFSAP